MQAKRKKATSDARIVTGTLVERRTLAKLEAKLEGLLDRGEVLAWDIGKAFDAIATSGLYHQTHATLREYADARFKPGYTSLWRYRRVAKRFTRRQVETHSVGKLLLGLDYIDLTPEDERPADLLLLGIRVPAGKRFKTIAFRDATVRQLEAAIGALKRPAETDSVDARASRRRSALQKLVDAPKRSGISAPLARAYATEDGSFRYDLRGIEEADLGRVGRALLTLARARK